ncbi:MAG TPA: peptidoglycan-binding domain-containing protein [Candidatus Sulfotelmatobacter sp.]|nr:peptidoglycan-binding domain-containing protein [Candidatus Sulfotelmatobacter sp.]
MRQAAVIPGRRWFALVVAFLFLNIATFAAPARSRHRTDKSHSNRSAHSKAHASRSRSRSTGSMRLAAFTGRPQQSAAAAPPSASNSNASSKSASKKKSKKRRSKREPTQKAPTPDRISEIQSALARGGYYEGDPSGKWDAKTIGAMQKFQSANGIEPNGKLDAISLQKLGLGSDTAGVSAPKPPSPPSCCGTSQPQMPVTCSGCAHAPAPGGPPDPKPSASPADPKSSPPASDAKPASPPDSKPPQR